MDAWDEFLRIVYGLPPAIVVGAELVAKLATELKDLIILSVAFFFLGWFLIHRYRVNLVEPNATAFSTLKALIIFFLLVFALGVVAFAFGSLVWFCLGFFIPGISDKLRMNWASMASTMLCLYLLVGRPLSLLSKAKKKQGDNGIEAPGNKRGIKGIKKG